MSSTTEKKSPMPYIITIIVLVVGLAASIYWTIRTKRKCVSEASCSLKGYKAISPTNCAAYKDSSGTIIPLKEINADNCSSVCDYNTYLTDNCVFPKSYYTNETPAKFSVDWDGINWTKSKIEEVAPSTTTTSDPIISSAETYRRRRW